MQLLLLRLLVKMTINDCNYNGIISNLVFVLSLGNPLSSDLDLGSDKTFHHVIAVQSKQEGNLLRLCITQSSARIDAKLANPLIGTGNYSATSTDMMLIHWSLMSGLLHLVQRGGDWAGPQSAQAPPRCTKCNSPSINGQFIPTSYYFVWHYNYLRTLKG